ncbi:MAG: hypothetical protein ACTSYF_12910 [Promethearchaeota archaeon]
MKRVAYGWDAVNAQYVALKVNSDGEVVIDDTITGPLTITGDLTVDTNTLYVDSANDRVGIGTTSPSNKLTVEGTNNIRAEVKSTDANSQAGLFLTNDAQQWLFQVQGSDSDKLYIHDQTGGNTIMVIRTNGNVGIGTTAPNSRLQVNGSLAVKRTATATDYTTAGETIIGVTDTSAARTITLASADCVAGRIIIIKDESGGAGTNNITVATQGTETIDGAATQTISTNYGVLRLYSDGNSWFTF